MRMCRRQPSSRPFTAPPLRRRSMAERREGVMLAGMTVKLVRLGGDLGQQFIEQGLFADEGAGAGIVRAGAFAEIRIGHAEVVLLDHAGPGGAEVEGLSELVSVVAEALEIS